MKICDFGLCRSVAEIMSGVGPTPVLTDYVATRWYRAPGMLLRNKVNFSNHVFSDILLLQKFFWGQLSIRWLLTCGQ